MSALRLATIDRLDPSLRPCEAAEGPLSMNERAELNRLETEFAKVSHAFNDGNAVLLSIHEKRLYRGDGTRTFDAYLLEVLGMSSGHGYRRLKAAQVDRNLEGEALPSNERVARVLAEYSQEMQKRIWERVDKATAKAKDVERAAQEILLESAARTAEAVPARDQAKIAGAADRKLRQAASQRATKEERAKAIKKALAWGTKYAALLERIEAGQYGDLGNHGISVEARGVESKVRIWLG